MFLARYAIAPCPSSLGSVDEVDGAGAEVRLTARLRGLDSAPDHLCEIACDAAAAAAGGEAGQVEAHPGDHVVLGVGTVSGDRVVDGEEQVGAEPRLQRSLNLRGVPLGA